MSRPIYQGRRVEGVAFGAISGARNGDAEGMPLRAVTKGEKKAGQPARAGGGVRRHSQRSYF